MATLKYWDGAAWQPVTLPVATTGLPSDSLTRTSGNITLNSTSFTSVDGTGALDLTVEAQAGDVLLVTATGLIGNEGTAGIFDVATLVSSTLTNYVSSGNGTQPYDGMVGWYGGPGEYGSIGTPALYTVQAGDLEGGMVTLRLLYRTSTAANKTFYAASTQLFKWGVVNLRSPGVTGDPYVGSPSGATVVGTGSVGGASTMTISMPAGIAAGDFAVLGGQFVNSTPNTNGPDNDNSWTELMRYDTSSSEWQVVYAKVLAGTETEVTFTHSAGTDTALALVVYRGVDTVYNYGYSADSLTTPGLVGRKDSLHVLVYMRLQGDEIDITEVGDLVEDIYFKQTSTNNPRVLIAHRDCVARFDALPISATGAASAYTGAFAAVIYAA